MIAYKLSGSFDGELNGTASFSLNSNTASYTQNSISSSHSNTSSISFNEFTVGTTLLDVSGINLTSSMTIWYCPFNCQLLNIYGRKLGAGTVQINVRKSGSAGYSYHTSSITLSNTWISPNSIVSQSYNNGDSMEFIVTGSGITEISIQTKLKRN